MKKVILCFLTLALLVGLSCMVMSATDVGVILTLSETDVGRGDTFTMTVSISGDSKMKSAMVLANFDSEVLELVNGEWLIDGTIENFSPEDKGGFFAAERELDTQGDIFQFTFKVKDAAAISSTAISCTVDLKNGTNSLPLGTISPISLTVTACNHTYDEWQTYNETQHQRVCSKCGNVEYRNHVWDSGVVTTEPTHTTFGEKTFTCTACGETKTEQIAKLPEHTYGTWEKHNETQHKRTCSCGKVEYADHTWDAGKVTTEPTSTSNGVKTYTCTVCSATKTEIIFAEDVPKVVVDSVKAMAGSTVQIDIILSGAPNLESLSISNISYDTENLELIDFEWKTIDALLSNWDVTTGKGAIAYDSSIDINGTIASLTFQIKPGTADGDYNISCVVATKECDLKNVSGKITVYSVILGDVNGDESVDKDDAIYLLMYSFFPEDYPINQGADYNSDGSIDKDDAIYLLMYTFFPEDYPLVFVPVATVAKAEG